MFVNISAMTFIILCRPFQDLASLNIRINRNALKAVNAPPLATTEPACIDIDNSTVTMKIMKASKMLKRSAQYSRKPSATILRIISITNII